MEQQNAIRIVEVGEEDKILTLNIDILEEILNKPEIRDRSISVISIAGAIRKGKSFILNFFLRYLKSRVCAHNYGYNRFTIVISAYISKFISV